MIVFGAGRHQTARRSALDSDCSIDVPVDCGLRAPSDEGGETIYASVTCPYCWEESVFIERVESGEHIVISCERTQRDFGICLGFEAPPP